MRRWIGLTCILLGMICLLGSLGFTIYNRLESKNAATYTETILADVQSKMKEEKIEPYDSQIEMSTVKVDGYDCIGILTIPVLELELPVLTDWSYEKLKKAPCHYYGSYYEKDFVIAAHNYNAHFGRLSQLQEGDDVMFTDVSGNMHCYKVVLSETLPKNATKEMITSGFDLSLYTCTPGGASRVTVRCSTTQETNQKN